MVCTLFFYTLTEIVFDFIIFISQIPITDSLMMTHLLSSYYSTGQKKSSRLSLRSVQKNINKAVFKC